MAALRNCKLSTRPKQGKIGKNRRRRAVASVTIAAASQRRLLQAGGGAFEFFTAHRRNSLRLRAPVLGRKYQRTVRAAVLLRGVRVARALPARDAEFSSRAGSSLTGLFGGLVWFLAAFGGTLADRLGFRRSLSLAYFILTCAYFLLGSLGSRVAGAVACSRAAGGFGRIRVDAAGVGNCAGEALRGGDHRAVVERKCSLHRLLDLLHAGEYRRRGGAVRRFLCSPAHASRKCISRRRVQRVPDVLRR